MTKTSGLAVMSAMNSSSTSTSRTPWAKPSMPARSSSLASARSKMWATTRSPCRVRLVDDRPIHRRRQLLHGAVAIVHPDLDDVHLLGRQLPNGGPRLRFGRHSVGAASRRYSAPGPALGSAIPRPAVRKSAAPGAGAARSWYGEAPRDRPPCSALRDAVVGVAAQMIDEVLAGEVGGAVLIRFTSV